MILQDLNLYLIFLDSIFEVVKKIDFRQINKLIVVDDCYPLNNGKN